MRVRASAILRFIPPDNSSRHDIDPWQRPTLSKASKPEALHRVYGQIFWYAFSRKFQIFSDRHAIVQCTALKQEANLVPVHPTDRHPGRLCFDPFDASRCRVLLKSNKTFDHHRFFLEPDLPMITRFSPSYKSILKPLEWRIVINLFTNSEDGNACLDVCVVSILQVAKYQKPAPPEKIEDKQNHVHTCLQQHWQPSTPSVPPTTCISFDNLPVQ